jgi:hypothetical protein
LSAVNAQAELPTARWENVQVGVHDLRLVLPPSDEITGVVELPDGSHEAGCAVHAFVDPADPEGWPEATGFTDEKGRFRIPVPQGSRRSLTAQRHSVHPGDEFDWARALDVRAGTKDVVLRLVHQP